LFSKGPEKSARHFKEEAPLILSSDLRSEESLELLFSVVVKNAVNPSEDPFPPFVSSDPPSFSCCTGSIGTEDTPCNDKPNERKKGLTALKIN
jgi:hypothetical protein